ncbi:MAG: hydrogenase maturation protease [Proteobacteria bacterium]|nr:hydrogenase maturation protease [Pseudomonadota bacterium]
MKPLFLGVGNLHRADDGVGPLLAERLAQDAELAQIAEIMPHSGEGASLMHLWEGRERVIVVDAMKSGQPLGTIHRFDAIAQTLSYGVFRYSSHLFGLAEATEMSRALDMLPAEMIIYGIEGSEYTFAADMSDEVAQSLKKVEADVRADILRD